LRGRIEDGVIVTQIIQAIVALAKATRRPVGITRGAQGG
jgi:hypothetical protein